MRRAILLAGVALGLTCGLAGCAGMDLTSLFIMRGDPSSGDRVLVGSLDAVAQSTQTSLTRLGLKATITPGAEAYYINSETINGAKFRLVLTRVQTTGGERTRVRWEWQDTRTDGSTSATILTEVEKTHNAR